MFKTQNNSVLKPVTHCPKVNRKIVEQDHLQCFLTSDKHKLFLSVGNYEFIFFLFCSSQWFKICCLSNINTCNSTPKWFVSKSTTAVREGAQYNFQ